MILSDHDCRRLMRAAQTGDSASYRALLGGARDWLQRYFARRIAPAMLDDLVQETLLSLHAKRASYDAALPFYPWMAAIARYRWIDALRSLTRKREDELVEIAVASDEDAILSRLSIDGLLSHLPEGQSLAISLTRIEGLSVAETAKLTGQSEALVKVNVHRGLKRLAALVESE